MNEFFDLAIRLLPGLGTSVMMAAASLAVGLPLGFIAGLALNSKSSPLRYVVMTLVEIFRGFPALLTLYLVYFGLTSFITLDRFASIVVAFGLTTAAYAAEIFRAGIANVPRGQIEAAEALALSKFDVTLRVIVPHVMSIVVPPIIGIAIISFQGTALAYAIGGKELLGTAYSIGMIDFKVLQPLLVAALLYLLFTSLLAWMEIIADRRAARISGNSPSQPKSMRRKKQEAKDDVLPPTTRVVNTIS